MPASPEPPATTGTSIHRRTYDCEAFEEGEGLMRVRGHLNDTKPHGLGLADGTPLVIHDMTVDLLVTVPDFTITGVETAMGVHPYGLCTEVLPDYQQLVGMSITRGYARRVRELFGGPGGCSHMGALLIALGPVAIQASWSLTTLHDDLGARMDEDIDAQAMERRLRMNTNTCHVWKEGGAHLTAVSLGTSEARPDWEVTRLRSLGLIED